MNKAQLVDAMAARAGLSKADAKKALEAFIGATTDTMKGGDRLAMVGFGTFSVTERAARKGRNPRTGATISIGAKKVVKFKPSKELVDGDWPEDKFEGG